MVDAAPTPVAAIGATAGSDDDPADAALLAQVDSFGRQFAAVYPGRRPLVLLGADEGGARRFVPTALRPGVPPGLAQTELYDAAGTAAFFAGALECVAPPAGDDGDPAALPSLRSAAATWAAGGGTALELASLLCGVLLGAGYDAYVVSGLTPAWLAAGDTSRDACPFTPPPDAVDVDTHTSPLALLGPSEGVAPLAVKHATPAAGVVGMDAAAAAVGDGDDAGGGGGVAATSPSSRYALPPLDAILGATAAAAPSATARAPAPAAVATQQAGNATPTRHAWVLLRPGPRGVAAPTFIDAPTGTLYPATASETPFLAVDSVWNAHNYWVNMQGAPLLPGLAAGPATLARLADPVLQAHPLVPLLRQALVESSASQPTTAAAAALHPALASPYAAGLELDRLAADAVARSVELRSRLRAASAATDTPPPVAVDPPPPPPIAGTVYLSGAPRLGSAGAAGVLARLPPDTLRSLTVSLDELTASLGGGSVGGDAHPGATLDGGRGRSASRGGTATSGQ